MTAGVSVNPLQVQVAKLVTAPPSFMDKQEYLSLIAPQLNKLIVYASRKNDGVRVGMSNSVNQCYFYFIPVVDEGLCDDRRKDSPSLSIFM